jgi:iron(III) transport system ATP-binding protein
MTLLEAQGLDVGYKLPGSGLFGGSRFLPIVHDVSFTLEPGHTLGIVGESGCGKSTLGRALLHLTEPSAGKVLWQGQDMATIPELRRRRSEMQIIFQDPVAALDPRMTLARIVSRPLATFEPGLTRHEARARAVEALGKVGLSADFADRYPHELSGGQQQRVALARAMAPEPELLLLDEPFSNLDVDLRERLAGEVRDILKANGTTALLVTHDQFEAFAIADDIGVMVDGCFVQWDSAYNLYHRPATRFVADFVGYGVFVPGVTKPGPSVEIELGLLPLPQSSYGLPNEEVDVLLRADDIVHDNDSPLQAEVITKAFRGGDFLYTVQLDSGQRLLTMVPSHHNHAIGEKIGIKLVADHVVTFSK